MRHFLSVIFFSLLLFVGASASAQTLKFGHIDFQGLIAQMPERDVAQKAMTKMQTDLESQLGVMQKEYQTKGQEYVALVKQANVTDAIRQAKEADIQSLQERITTFQQQAQDNLQKEETKQFQPVVEKARKAIAEVAKEQGMLYVFEVNSVLYFNPAQSTDMMPLVKAKLGLK
ncbi:MAG: OmpH family outer membrane protein [Bacteroidetes bacterium]|nr:OmpH family outer membrane protein [Bacteroidota bacterium]MCL6103985.1 OmpH family outer membrane protein [Bacteroidota bacterium]